MHREKILGADEPQALHQRHVEHFWREFLEVVTDAFQRQISRDTVLGHVVFS